MWRPVAKRVSCLLSQSYRDEGQRGDVTMAAKTLGELVSRKLTPASALAAAVEVKVETTVVSGEPGECCGALLWEVFCHVILCQ